MRVLEWLSGSGSSSLVATDSTGSFDEPVTVTVQYDTSWIPHLDASQLTIYRWDDAAGGWIGLLTTIDAESHQASAQTSLPGHFDLQASLVCPADELEPNDNYDGASVVQIDGSTVASLFDIAGDEDWFEFAAAAGAEYAIRTTDLAAGVDTVLEIYDADGVTLLASDDNGGGGKASSFTWVAPSDGLYFVRVSPAVGSDYGCASSYQLTVMENWRVFLPLIAR
jgi:hypothetical protein